MLTLSAAVKLWYCPAPVDMRLGFDGLFALETSRLHADPLSGHLFIFRNRSADRLKVLQDKSPTAAVQTGMAHVLRALIDESLPVFEKRYGVGEVERRKEPPPPTPAPGGGRKGHAP